MSGSRFHLFFQVYVVVIHGAGFILFFALVDAVGIGGDVSGSRFRLFFPDLRRGDSGWH